MSFKDFKSVRIWVEKPNLMQWFIVKSANFLLWLLFLVHDDDKFIDREVKDITQKAYNAIINCS